MTNQEIYDILDNSKRQIDAIIALNIRYIGVHRSTVLKKLQCIANSVDFKGDISGKGFRERYKQKEKERYLQNPKKCEYCGKEIPFEKRFNKCCSTTCAISLGNTGKIKSVEAKQNIKNGLKKVINTRVTKIIGDKRVTTYKTTTGQIKQIITDIEKSKEYKLNYKKYKCKVCGKEFTLKDKRDCSGHLYCSKECKHKYLSKRTGGYRKGSGRGKGGWYKGIYCDSSWELAFVIYHLDNNFYIERNKASRKYIFEGKEREYYPDFITNNGLIEIKGFSTEQWKAKIEQNPDIKVLYKKDIQPYLEYVISKYGKDFIYLYEK